MSEFEAVELSLEQSISRCAAFLESTERVSVPAADSRPVSPPLAAIRSDPEPIAVSPIVEETREEFPLVQEDLAPPQEDLDTMSPPSKPSQTVRHRSFQSPSGRPAQQLIGGSHRVAGPAGMRRIEALSQPRNAEYVRRERLRQEIEDSALEMCTFSPDISKTRNSGSASSAAAGMPHTMRLHHAADTRHKDRERQKVEAQRSSIRSCSFSPSVNSLSSQLAGGRPPVHHRFKDEVADRTKRIEMSRVESERVLTFRPDVCPNSTQLVSSRLRQSGSAIGEVPAHERLSKAKTPRSVYSQKSLSRSRSRAEGSPTASRDGDHSPVLSAADLAPEEDERIPSINPRSREIAMKSGMFRGPYADFA
ncbi:hypothetical protein KIPB_007682, partial [Kipferlia bialata]|eukprot:g5782.t1